MHSHLSLPHLTWGYAVTEGQGSIGRRQNSLTLGSRTAPHCYGRRPLLSIAHRRTIQSINRTATRGWIVCWTSDTRYGAHACTI